MIIIHAIVIFINTISTTLIISKSLLRQIFLNIIYVSINYLIIKIKFTNQQRLQAALLHIIIKFKP